MCNFDRNEPAFFTCASCQRPILSKFYLRLSQPSKDHQDQSFSQFHLTCLRCSRCGFQLDETDKKCWANRLYGVLCQFCHRTLTHCSKCKNYMPRDSWVQRVFDSAFHVDCFTCALCNRQLQFGECIVFSQGEIFCAWHSYAHQPPPFAKAQTKPPPAGRDPVPLRDTYLDQALEEELVDEDGHPIGTEDISSPSKPNSISQPSSGSEITFDESHICEENSVNTVTPFTSFIQSHQQPQRSASRSIVGSQQRSKRIRTSFTPQQIAVLQASFKTVSNPDGQELERIAQATCLTKRVTQVWFQNARARKKKTVRNPDLQQQPNSPRQAMNCSGGGSGSGIGARRGGLAGDFVPNEALNDATDRVMESEADMWIPQSISPQLAATLEVPEPKPYFTKETCLQLRKLAMLP
uniref:LIM/homeobox protein Awh n=1 Tax=Mesocestoides corti TaxID=53468 RepID=A0A5K3EGP5_MESCO